MSVVNLTNLEQITAAVPFVMLVNVKIVRRERKILYSARIVTEHSMVKHVTIIMNCKVEKGSREGAKAFVLKFAFIPAVTVCIHWQNVLEERRSVVVVNLRLAPVSAMRHIIP